MPVYKVTHTTFAVIIAKQTISTPLQLTCIAD